MKIKGKDKFLAQIAALPGAIRAEVRKALETAADETTDVMRRFVPVKSGKLRASIGSSFGSAPKDAGLSSAGNARAAKSESGLAVTMFSGNQSTIVRNSRGVEFQLARLQEFGTQKMPANPYFFPAYRLGKKRAKARLSRAIRAGARKAFGK